MINYVKKNIVFTCFIITFLVGYFLFDITTSNKIPQAELINTQKTNYKYILSDHNGYIALFDTTKQEPIEVYNILTESLPLKDINKIKNGIYANSIDELNILIEEYTS